MHVHVLLWTAYWFFWTIVAAGVRLSFFEQKLDEQADGRVVGFVHAATALTLLATWTDQALPCSTGYFLWELLYSFMARDVDKSMRFHAIMCFTGYALFLTHGEADKVWWARVFLVYEVSTVFMHVAWFMHKMWRDSPCTFCAKVIFFFTFMFFRVMLGTALTIHYLHSELEKDISTWTMVGVYHAILVLSSWILNLYWFTKLIRMLSSCDPDKKNSN